MKTVIIDRKVKSALGMLSYNIVNSYNKVTNNIGTYLTLKVMVIWRKLKNVKLSPWNFF